MRKFSFLSGIGSMLAMAAGVFGIGRAGGVTEEVMLEGISGGRGDEGAKGNYSPYIPQSRKEHKRQRKSLSLYRDGRRRYEPNGAREVARRLRQKAKIEERRALA